MTVKSTILIFLDDDSRPIAEVPSPVNFELDTRKLVDGEHVLRIVGRDPTGKEGVRTIPFVVRNGPAIDVEGMKEHAVVDGVVPLMVNAWQRRPEVVPDRGKRNAKEHSGLGMDTDHRVRWLGALLLDTVFLKSKWCR